MFATHHSNFNHLPRQSSRKCQTWARRWNRQADEAVARIRAALIEQGDLPRPVKSAEEIEKERIERGLLAIRNNPDHNEIVEFEGKRYQCKYRKLDKMWLRNWVPVDG